MNVKTRSELEAMTVAQLKEHATELGVSYTSKIRKADLIDAICAQSSRHMPSAERVKAYARSRGASRKGVKLTHRQWRRVEKNERKHGKHLSLTIGNSKWFNPANGYALLARTPEGFGIWTLSR